MKSGGTLSGLFVYGWHTSVFSGSRFWDLKSHYIMCYVTCFNALCILCQYATVLYTMNHLWASCKVGPCDMTLNQYEPNPDSPNSHNSKFNWILSVFLGGLVDRICVCIMLSFYALCAIKVVYTDFTRPVLLNLASFLCLQNSFNWKSNVSLSIEKKTVA